MTKCLIEVSLPVSIIYDLLNDDVVVILFSHQSDVYRELLEPSLINRVLILDCPFNSFPENRTPNRYHNSKAEEFTVERIHPSVHFRQEYHRELQKTHKNLKIYEPAALKGWVRIYEKHGMGIGMKERKGWRWIKHELDTKGNRLLDSKGEPVIENSLWEFEIGIMPADKSVERWLIDNSWVESIHKEIQNGWKGS